MAFIAQSMPQPHCVTHKGTQRLVVWIYFLSILVGLGTLAAMATEVLDLLRLRHTVRSSSALPESWPELCARVQRASLSAAMDSQQLAQLLDMPVNHIRVILCLILAYPLGVPLNIFPTNTAFRVLYSTLLGFAFSLYCFELHGTMFILSVALAMYVGLGYCRNNKRGPPLAMLGLVAALSIAFVVRFVASVTFRTDGGREDIFIGSS